MTLRQNEYGFCGRRNGNELQGMNSASSCSLPCRMLRDQILHRAGRSVDAFGNGSIPLCESLSLSLALHSFKGLLILGFSLLDHALNP